MTTEVVLTGTGVPHPRPGCAGAGTLVRSGDVALQFDAGRATVLRLMEAGTAPHALTALFVTHVHSDHVVDLADVAMTRWLQQQLVASGPLVVVAPEGGAARFVRRMLEPFDDDLALRVAHIGAEPIEVDLRPFAVPSTPEVVWVSDDGTVRVRAVAVHHEPVPDAVAYRVETPDGAVVISGDTRVCDEVERLATGADVLVHEACRTTALAPLIAGTVFEKIFGYHADTVALGAMAERSGVPHVVLTHLVPPLEQPGDAAAFAQDLRDGGYRGAVTVGEDLTSVTLERQGPGYGPVMSEDRDVVTVERVIPAPPEAIFAVLRDPKRHHEIDGSGTVRDARGDTEPLEMGSRFGMSMKMGLPYSMASTVVEYEPDRRIAWQTRGPGPIGRHVGGRIWRYELEPVDGGTLVKESWDITQESPVTRPIVRMGGKTTAKNMAATLERIEQLLAG